MRLIAAAAAGIILALSACVDADMETRVLDADRVQVTGHIQVERAMFEMFGGPGDFCREEEGGVLELTDAHARCTITQTGSFEQVFVASEEADVPAPTATDLGDGTVRVSFPLGDALREAEQMVADPNMVAMFRPMMEGRNIVLRISGAQILSSTGTVSPDGTTATLRIGLTDLIDAPQTLPETFGAFVRY
jgi:hypothetical protein